MDAPLPIAIIGGGLQGIAAARFCQRRGLACALFERRSTLGGVWSADGGPANAHSLVQTEAASYSLDLPCGDADADANAASDDDEPSRGGGGAPRTGEHVRAYAARFAATHGIDVRLRTEVTRCSRETAAPDGGGRCVQVEYRRHSDGGGDDRNCGGGRVGVLRVRAVICLAGRWTVPRALPLAGAARFGGVIASGRGGDVPPLAAFAGARVVVVGVGAFAVECARVSLERGARHVTLLDRRDDQPWAVAPRFASWAINANGAAASANDAAASADDANGAAASADDARGARAPTPAHGSLSPAALAALSAPM